MLLIKSQVNCFSGPFKYSSGNFVERNNYSDFTFLLKNTLITNTKLQNWDLNDSIDNEIVIHRILIFRTIVTRPGTVKIASAYNVIQTIII